MFAEMFSSSFSCTKKESKKGLDTRTVSAEFELDPKNAITKYKYKGVKGVKIN